MKLVKTAVAGIVSIVVAGTAFAAEITGAGASFPAPVYSKWADAYQKATGNKVNYQSIGSSGGIKQINAKTVDFASEKGDNERLQKWLESLDPEEMGKYKM